MKLTESMTVHQQQLLIDGILELACRAGIIKSRSLVTNGQLVLMLLDDMSDMLAMERPVKLFKEGIIMPQGFAMVQMAEETDERTGKSREVKTSRVISEVDGQFVTEFETLNTVYRAVEGASVEDLRYTPPKES